MKRATYQLVPASKRERFADLTEQITQSVGRYVLGQASLAACNGVASFIFLSIIQARSRQCWRSSRSSSRSSRWSERSRARSSSCSSA